VRVSSVGHQRSSKVSRVPFVGSHDVWAPNVRYFSPCSQNIADRNVSREVRVQVDVTALWLFQVSAARTDVAHTFEASFCEKFRFLWPGDCVSFGRDG
jgi:hypothetical protein